MRHNSEQQLTNPWLAIPLDDYEGHMTLPTVQQASLLSAILDGVLQSYHPKSVCMVGCTGGNGFDTIPRDCRVCGIEINPTYVAVAESRFANQFANHQFITCDIEAGIPGNIGQFDLVYTAWLFEYVDVERALSSILPLASHGGMIVVVAQLATAEMQEISETPFTSLYRLDGLMRLIDVDWLSSRFAGHGFTETLRAESVSMPGKHFCIMHFAKTHDQHQLESL